MIVLNTKTFQELQDEGLSELVALGFSTNRGAIARLFLSVVNSRVDAAYRALTVNHIRAFLSTSYGDALDQLGLLLNCYRNSDDDEKFRYRISKQCLILASSNETAVRLAAYSVQGVYDILVKPYAMGSGSFAVIAVVENEVEDVNTVLQNVRDNISETCAYGIRFLVHAPTLTRVKFKFTLYIKDNVSDAGRQELKYAARQAVADYIANLKIGEDIVIDQITQALMDVSDDIVSHQNTGFWIDGEKALYVNQSCRWFEKFALSLDPDNIVIL